MTDTYLTRTSNTTPTRVWVSNPTPPEVGSALTQGEVGCAANPACGGGLLRRTPDLVRPAIEAAAAATDDTNAANGWVADVASIVAEEGIDYLVEPTERIPTRHVPLPASETLEDAALLFPKQIAERVRRATP